MTGFDLGDPADDADDEPKPEPEQSDSRRDRDSESEPEPEPEREPEPSQTEEPAPETETETETDPTESGPAFEYSTVRQSPLYARAETWDKVEDELAITVTPELRQRGVRDDELREVHDALLKVALENIDDVPEQVLQTRRES